MPTNNHALIRYRTIDRCLKGGGTYHLRDLIEQCSNDVDEYEQRVNPQRYKGPMSVSRRTVLNDLKFMKDEEHGFGAPIKSDRDDGYYYSIPRFEVFKAKIAQTDLEELDDILHVLRDIAGNAQFADLESTITRLEETYAIIRSRRARPVILFEHSTNIEGQKWVGDLKKSIQSKKPLSIHYQPFDKEAYHRIVSPYFLKEYNNRWFLIGYEHIEPGRISTLGLDRIISIKPSLQKYHTEQDFDPKSHLKNLIGVTVEAKPVTKITFKAYGLQRHYIKTKPLHDSQKEIKMTKDYGIFSIDVIPNYELMSVLISKRATLEVLKPLAYRDKVKNEIEMMVTLYQ